MAARLICSTSRWREGPVSRELRSCAVVGVEARRRATEPARVDAHQKGRREGLAQGFSRRRTLLGRLAALRFGGEVADRVAGLLAGIADQQRLDAAALAQLDLVGGSSPKGSICGRPSGARTPPSASPSTPHLGAEWTRSSAHQSLPMPLGLPCQSMGCSAGWPPRATRRRTGPFQTWRPSTPLRRGCPACGLTRSCC